MVLIKNNLIFGLITWVVVNSIFSCKGEVENSTRHLYHTDSLDNGFLIKYFEKNDSVFVKVSKNKIKHEIYFSTVDAIKMIDKCLLYKPVWWNKSTLILERGCGHPFDEKQNYVYKIIDGNLKFENYTNIFYFDSLGIGAYFYNDKKDDYKYKIVLTDFHTGLTQDTFTLEMYADSIELENSSPNLMEDLDFSFIDGDRKKVFEFIHDTVFFRFFKKDTFHVLDKKEIAVPFQK